MPSTARLSQKLEFTFEQRQVLAKAYSLIISWSRKKQIQPEERIDDKLASKSSMEVCENAPISSIHS